MNEDNKKRIPISLGVGSPLVVANYSGQSSSYLFQNPKMHYKYSSWVCDMFGSDDTPSYSIQNGTFWDFGGEIIFSKKNKLSYPQAKNRIINTLDDIEKLQLPTLEVAPAFQNEIEFFDIKHNNGMKVMAKGGSMLELMQQLCGTNNLLRWLVKEPNQMHIFYRKITDYIYARIDYLINRYGEENVCLLDTYQLDNDEIISRKTFEEMSLPYIIELHEKYRDINFAATTVHLCGNHRKSLHYWLDDIYTRTGTLFYIGTELDIEKTARILGDKYSIGGNLPNQLIQSGSPEQLYRETKDLVLKMKYHPGGYVLMPDCSLTATAPAINIHAIIKAAKKYGYLE